MKTNKYYTPDISEFYVGFEYEAEDLWDNGISRVWKHQVFEGEETRTYFIEELQNNEMRVKYLDSDDIESLGFEFKYNEKNNENIAFTKKYDNHPRYDNQYVDIIWNHVSNHILICEGDNETCWSDWVTRFSGKIKNKSELKRTLKQIGYEGK